MNKKLQPYLICGACNYFHCEVEEDGQIKTIRGDEPFKEIYFNRIDISGFNNPDAFACPKCKTVRLS